MVDDRVDFLHAHRTPEKAVIVHQMKRRATRAEPALEKKQLLNFFAPQTNRRLYHAKPNSAPRSPTPDAVRG
jgi:hypothetical protein